MSRGQAGRVLMRATCLSLEVPYVDLAKRRHRTCGDASRRLWPVCSHTWRGFCSPPRGRSRILALMDQGSLEIDGDGRECLRDGAVRLCLLGYALERRLIDARHHRFCLQIDGTDCEALLDGIEMHAGRCMHACGSEACACQASGERHRVAPCVGRADEFLWVCAVRSIAHARAERIVPLERAASQAHAALAFLKIPLPFGICCTDWHSTSSFFLWLRILWGKHITFQGERCSGRMKTGSCFLCLRLLGTQAITGSLGGFLHFSPWPVPALMARPGLRPGRFCPYPPAPRPDRRHLDAWRDDPLARLNGLCRRSRVATPARALPGSLGDDLEQRPGPRATVRLTHFLLERPGLVAALRRIGHRCRPAYCDKRAPASRNGPGARTLLIPLACRLSAIRLLGCFSL